MFSAAHIEFSSRDFFQSRKRSEAFVEETPNQNGKRLAQFLKLPLWHDLAAPLVQKSNIDLLLVCLHAHNAF